MLDKFNFYDIYGYFIPGAVLVIILYSPLAILGFRPTVPFGDFSNVVLAVIVAYLIGYFIQSMATNAISSKFGGVYPSARMLDSSDRTLSAKTKENISSKCISLFKINVELSKEAKADTDVENARNAAFGLARALTNTRRSGTYSEQHQALYSMMRGLAVTFALSTLYIIGWGFSFFHSQYASNTIYALMSASLLVGIICAVWRCVQDDKNTRVKIILDRFGLCSLGGIALSGGMMLGQGNVFTPVIDLLFWGAAAFFLAATFRFYNSYEYFSNQFAKAVWTGFSIVDGPAGDGSNG